jgi:hypothetical protein
VTRDGVAIPPAPLFVLNLLEFLYQIVNYFAVGWDRKITWHCRMALRSVLERRVIK